MSVLDSIIDGVREDMATRRSVTPQSQLEQRLGDADPVRTPTLARADAVSIISEVKRSSPSKGSLAAIDDPAALARKYEAGGASAISVLTEQRRFGGSLADLDAVRAAVDLPILRKDFTVDEYQIIEARAHGADLILLIVAALDQYQLSDYLAITRALGMTALVETHTESEVDRALEIGADVLGVNARNLKTLEVDMSKFSRLVTRIPDGIVKVAESGVSSADDVRQHRADGADAVLTGEALVKAGDPEGSLRAMIESTRRPS